MANVKNYGLSGIGTSVQLGRSGPWIINNSGTLNFKASDATTDAAITSSAVTAITGNLTASAGNLVLTSTAGVVSIGGTSVIARGATGFPLIPGTGALQIPAGPDAARPGTPAIGMIRVSTQNPTAGVEYYNGTAWTGVSSTTTLNSIFPGTSGQIIYNVANSWAAGTPGVSSGVQPYDAGLTNLAVKSTTGLITQTGTDTYNSVQLVAPAEGITISNPDGVSGNPTFVLANDLAALEGLTTNGIIVRVSNGVAATRTITGTSGRVIVSNGDGVAGAPTVDLSTVANSGTGTFLKFGIDSYGRVVGTSSVTTADITTLVSGSYVDVIGDSMSGNLTMTSGATVTGIPTPVNATDAANKSYVDNAVTGISWKTACKVSTTINITLSGTQTIDGIVIGIGDRVLVKNQTTQADNGIYLCQSGVWIRTTDADTPAELDGAAVFVQQGTVWGDTGWVQTNTIATVGFTNVIWSQFSGASAYVAGAGLDLSGNVFSINFGAGIAQLPTDNVGIGLYNSANSALILTSNGTTRSALSGDGLALLLPTGSSLTQDSTGLYIGAGQVTNAKLANSSLILAANSGSGTVSLGGTLTVNGTTGQGITTSVATGTVTITAADATTTTKGVSSFNTASFTVSSGAVSLSTVDVPHGGTGLVTIPTGQILYGNGTAAVGNSSSLTYNGTTLVVNGLSFAGSTVTATTANASINLNPNGTGSVVVAVGAAARITSDTSQSLTLTGQNGLILVAGGTTNTTITLNASTTPKVRISGPTDVQYATGLTSVDLPNKYYVDSVATTNASGTLKAVQAVVPLTTNGTTNIGALLPANSTVLRVKVLVTSADASALLVIGDGTTPNRYMPNTENDCSTVGLYLSEVFDKAAGTIQIVATVSGTTGSGSATVFVEYQLV